MPVTQNAANPFFGNIRQNMDLIGGVGQLSIKHPSNMTKSVEEELPSWLKGAADENDHGKSVSDKFLQIEKMEQKRMQEALSMKVSYDGIPTAQTETAKPIQLAGIEKGSKNRYNSIWPYEHSRVRLQGLPDGACDYVNANHIQTSRSNKRYIATQGPLPATFNVGNRSRYGSRGPGTNLLLGLLECCLAAGRPRHRYVDGRAGRRPSEGSQLLVSKAIWESTPEPSGRT
jgi:protein-tyrosine phosphatase